LNNTQDNAGVIAPPPLLYLGALLLSLIIHTRLPIPVLPRTLRGFLGGLSIGIGIATATIAMRMMKQAGTNVQPNQPTTSILVDGPYSVSRNPIYISLTLFYSGLGLLINSIWPFTLLPLILLVMNRGVIEREERYLERKFGQAYTSYKARVRRWL
jgi:protein-S-isoprenylcysteine O-methyltransferase Ste14